jgi:hypothetical protein
MLQLDVSWLVLHARVMVSFFPEYEHVAPYLPPPILPAKALDAPKMTLVLDMDETLIHSSSDPRAPHDCELTIAARGPGLSLDTKVRSDISLLRCMSVSVLGPSGSCKRPPKTSKSSSSLHQR